MFRTGLEESRTGRRNISRAYLQRSTMLLCTIGSVATADDLLGMHHIHRHGIPIVTDLRACVFGTRTQAVDSARDSNKLMKLLHEKAISFGDHQSWRGIRTQPEDMLRQSPLVASLC
ncbi:MULTISPECIES: hypothetical protein [unclassified Methylobacterium]|uniref:hypothetical protein n=1 Tax=unclassified Methylobacterium TaxID=2615210 RepID=UPI000A6B8B08|nr:MULTISPECIES: hypothetical protein [unclassified Methylobacterium]